MIHRGKSLLSFLRQAERGRQGSHRRVGRDLRGQRVGVRPVDVTQGDAVERHLGIVTGRLELAGRLLKSWVAVLGLCLGYYGLPPGFRWLGPRG